MRFGKTIKVSLYCFAMVQYRSVKPARYQLRNTILCSKKQWSPEGRYHCVKSVRIRGYSGPNAGKCGPE